ncbi:metallophosphoesterase family protein [Mycobacteroides abscessus]|uniref:metallophosphoesterase family protein n=1 Tax=Mycobacteroides abscessus TaxID=36809 RepID=UPI000C25FEBE|nr:metallophosphoesterase [Mycobacteroides abscessus]
MLKQPSRVLIAGDWHGNGHWATGVIAYAHTRRCDVIIHLGDFGFARDIPDTRAYLDEVQQALEDTDLRLLWVDGNHEDHDRLNALDIDPISGLRFITSRIAHLPRGFRWSWHGQTWLALGGAHSIDRLQLKEGVSWWPTERLSLTDVNQAIAGGPADIMVCHDCPDRVGLPRLRGQWPTKDLAMSNENRRLLGTVVDAVQPKWLFHGHFHRRYDGDRVSGDGWRTSIVGLSQDATSAQDNTIVIELPLAL